MSKMFESDNTVVAQNRQFVHTQIPEFVEVMSIFHKEGLIDGWKNIVHVGPNVPDDNPKLVTPSWGDLSGRGFSNKEKT